MMSSLANTKTGQDGVNTTRSRAAALGWRPNQEQLVLIVTLLLALGFAVTLPGFATVGNALTLARNVSVLGVLALGMGLVVIARGLDLSQVAIMSASAALVVKLINMGVSAPIAVVAGLVVTAAVGAANGAIVAFSRIPPLFATLATSLLIYGLARFVLDEMIVYVSGNVTFLNLIGQGRLLGVPVAVLIFIAMAVATHLLLARTSVGRMIYAHGDNEEAAWLTGMAVRPLTLFEYVFSAFVALIAGLVQAGATGSVDTNLFSSTIIFDVILIVVLGGISLVGGRGSVLSIVAGTLLIGTLLNGLTIMNLDSEVQHIIQGVVLLAAVLLDNVLHPRDEETSKQGE
jgi:ribose transport system permease protein